jgi:8-oxo-dGTP diphosphatase
MIEFSGTKIGLLYRNKLLIIQRDDIPGLAFAGMWDFPGGGREGSETPQECAIREVQEELAISLSPHTILWEKAYPAMHGKNQIAYFMIAAIAPEQYEAITLGNEGQGWKLISIDEFMQDPTVVGPLKERLQDYLASSAPEITLE